MVERTRADETKRQLIEALVSLLGKRGIGSISVREIAAEAGVNHGLVHRHFGSKQNLVRAAIRELSEEIHRGDPVNRGLSAWSFDYLRRHPEIALVVARACLDGPRDLLALAAPPRDRLEAIVAPIGAMLAGFGLEGEVDPYLINALASVAFLGWVVFGPLVRTGFGLPPDADEQLVGLLRRLDDLLAPFR